VISQTLFGNAEGTVSVDSAGNPQEGFGVSPKNAFFLFSPPEAEQEKEDLNCYRKTKKAVA
jgi:uncharacterized protein (DUF2141 family)